MPPKPLKTPSSGASPLVWLVGFHVVFSALIIFGGALIVKLFGGDFASAAILLTLLLAAWWFLKGLYQMLCSLIRAFLRDIRP